MSITLEQLREEMGNLATKDEMGNLATKLADIKEDVKEIKASIRDIEHDNEKINRVCAPATTTRAMLIGCMGYRERVGRHLPNVQGQS